MGWSCSAKAGAVLKAWEDACAKSTGSSNLYEVGGVTYFYEVSDKEHGDGAITGAIRKMIGNGFCVKDGSFRIEPSGKVSRAPAFLKDAAKNAKPVYVGAIGSGGVF